MTEEQEKAIETPLYVSDPEKWIENISKENDFVGKIYDNCAKRLNSLITKYFLIQILFCFLK